MKILFLTRNYNAYISASYQQDFFKYLARQHEVFAYGRGFADYCLDDSLEDVLQKCPFNPELICVGHGWEWEDSSDQFTQHKKIRLDRVDIPKVMILNKEYLNLEKKLSFIRNNKIALVFSHYHGCGKYESSTGATFRYFPFAVDTELFRDYGLKKKYSVGFSGSIKLGYDNINIRKEIKKKLFLFQKFKRKDFRSLNIYWNTSSKKAIPHGVEYAKLLNSSKIWISVLSTYLDIPGPRYSEVMVSKTLLFCEQSTVYQTLFTENEHFVTFKDDLSNFTEKLLYYVHNKQERLAIVERAYQYVRENHSWERRIHQFNQEVAKKFNLKNDA